MTIIELREASYDKAFDLLDEVKLYGKKQKMVLCALEDAIYDCYEASKDDYEERDYEGYEDHEDFESEKDEEISYRNRRGMRGGMRDHSEGYRRNMRSNMRRNMR